MDKWLFPILALAVGIVIILLPLMLDIKVEKENRYSYLNCFPCEMAKSQTQRGIVIIAVMIWVMLAAESYAYNFISVRRVSFYSAMILQIISSLGFLAAVIFGLDHYKAHVISDVFFFLGEIGGNVTVLIGYLSNQGQHIVFNMPIAVIFGILGGILIIVLLMPQLKRWKYMQKSEENGKVVYIRPKVSSLALTEWIFFLGHIINMVLLTILPFIAE